MNVRGALRGVMLAVVAIGVVPATLIAQRSGYHVQGDASGGWALALEAVGFRATPPAGAAIRVVRAGEREPAGLDAAIADGAYVVIEGTGALAERFGFRAGRDSIDVRRELDARREGQMILWKNVLRLPRVTVPGDARVFSRERWSGAPLVAGRRIGRGAVLWTAASPGTTGYDRFPYVTHALADLGLTPPLVGDRLQIFFDYSYRTRADPGYMAPVWHRMGISRLFVSAWYFFERDTARDRYLDSLINSAHRQGITVYAWLELPHVSLRFWDEHPEWREKNGLLQDAVVDWRKLMNLLDPAAFTAASRLVRQTLDRFDWDGVILSELYFEGTRGLGVPADMTPFNDHVRREVQARHGFDPGNLFNAASPEHHQKRPELMQRFYEYRADLQRRLHEQWLDVLADVRRTKGSFGITVCYVDDISDPRMRNLIGADVHGLFPGLAKHGATLLVQDPFPLWALGPERYKRIAGEYVSLIPRERLAVDINIVERKQLTYPTRHQTGTELFQLVHTGHREFNAVALYAENSILPPDVPLLSSSLATVDLHQVNADGSVTVSSRQGVGVRWRGEASVGGMVWPLTTGEVVWLPPGRHTVSKSAAVPPVRVVDFNGDLRAVAPISNGVRIDYRSDARAIITLARAPSRVTVDGAAISLPRLIGDKGQVTYLLPAGEHRVEVSR